MGRACGTSRGGDEAPEHPGQPLRDDHPGIVQSALCLRVTYRVVLRLREGSEATLNVRDEQYILDAALDAGIVLPYSCLQGWCLTCAARLVEGTLDQSDSRRYYAQDRTEGFALLCTAKPRSDCVLETHARTAMRRARDMHRLPYPRGDWGTDEVD